MGALVAQIGSNVPVVERLFRFSGRGGLGRNGWGARASDIT